MTILEREGKEDNFIKEGTILEKEGRETTTTQIRKGREVRVPKGDKTLTSAAFANKQTSRQNMIGDNVPGHRNFLLSKNNFLKEQKIHKHRGVGVTWE